MPIETRTLLFDRDELRAAIHDYALSKEMASTEDRLLDVEVRPEAESTIVARVAGADNRPRSIELTYGEVTTALISFCKHGHIPLPRYGDKRLSPAGEGVALMIRMVFARSTG